MKFPGARCSLCTLLDETAVPSSLVENPDIVFVGEAPGAEEILALCPFVGQSGQILRSTYSALGGDPERASYINVVACRPPGNREPTELEITCCSGRFEEDLKNAGDNTTIVALGRTAHSALGVSYEDNGRWFGRVLPTWHPAYVLRKPGEASSFIRDLKIAIAGPSVVNNIPHTQVLHVTTIEELAQRLSEIPKGSWVSIDIETDQVNWYESNKNHQDPIIMLQMAWNTDTAMVLDDIMLYDTPGVIELLQQALEDKKVVGHNFKFDSVFLRAQTGLKLDATFDTYLAHYLLDENLPHGLKEIAKTELGMPDYEKDLIAKYLSSRNDHYSKIPFEYLAQYGALDVAATLILRQRLQAELESHDMMEWPMNNIIMPASAMLTQVELRGFKVDRSILSEVREMFQEDMDDRTGQLRDMVGRPDLNVDSPVQLAEVIYDQLGFPEQSHWKIKARSTAHDAIEKFKGHPFIDLLLAYRRVAKMKRAYAENIWNFMEPGTDLVHADFRIPGTEVGRLSVADPALQTIPRASEFYGALIRSLFIPREGHKLCVADYSQAELRCLGALSNEQFLIDVYAHDRDLHTEVAIAMFGLNFTKEHRVMCKMFNFAYAYGGTEKSFAEDAGLNINVAREFVQKYNQNMPTALAWKRSQKKTMVEEGEVKTIFGRRRRFPLVTPLNENDAAKASVHMPVASTANDLTLLAAIELHKVGIPIVLLVHDSILADVPEDQAREVVALMKSTMEDMGRKYIPQIAWKADAEIKDRWAKIPERPLQ